MLFLTPANRLRTAFVCALGLLTLAGCSEDEPAAGLAALGNPEVGRELIGEYGCGACHQIPGIADAEGMVGPPLDSMGKRKYIAGKLRNTPANMVLWLRDPHAVEPGTVMPDVGLTHQEASDLAAYLYTLE